MRRFLSFTTLALLSIPPSLGCDAPSSTSRSTPCETTLDCNGDTVCVAYGKGTGECLPTCSFEADECGAQAACAGVGVASVQVCQPEQMQEEAPEPTEPGKPSEPQAIDPEEQPRLPCMTDADCEPVLPGAICATWQGIRDCTLPCSVESDCDTPGAGGFSIDFFACQPDEGDEARTACLPDPACFMDVLACVDGFPGGDDVPEDTDGFPDTGGFPF